MTLPCSHACFAPSAEHDSSTRRGAKYWAANFTMVRPNS